MRQNECKKTNKTNNEYHWLVGQWSCAPTTLILLQSQKNKLRTPDLV